ncbi:trypsin-like serine peptidase [Enterococcus plantarum]|uniref:trypsin-like serine peptidase n=1 Tax=Enterococcus TaxID=1350 RepID=UPI000AC64793|nr:serine protease [Enterococcus plantarum]
MKLLKIGFIGVFLLGATFFSFAPKSEAVGVEHRSIIGVDERSRVFDTTLAPYQSTVYVSSNGYMGSGAVIGKNTVLTAAHVVKRIMENPTKATNYVIPGRNGATLPYGKFKIKQVHIPQRYLDKVDLDHDIAVLTLEENNGHSIGDVVKQNPMVLTNTVSIGNTISSMGYPGDKPFGTMWESKGKIIRQSTNRIDHDIDTVGGQSGSPIFNENHEIIAVHVSGGKYNNSSVKLNTEHIEFVLKYIGDTSN